MKVTLDTNVLISATFWSGDSYKIMKLIYDKKIKLVLSDEILKEYFDVIKRDEIVEKVENKGLIIAEIIDSIIQVCEMVKPIEKVDILKDDPDDNKILECAIAGNSDYIVSQDKDLLELKEFRGIKIVNPKEILNILEKSLI